MTLHELGRQYAAEADNLAGLIASCSKRQRAALRAGTKSEARRQDIIANYHASQQEDVLQIAHWLLHYHDDVSACDNNPLATRGWVRI